jgi:hypothetical protein
VTEFSREDNHPFPPETICVESSQWGSILKVSPVPTLNGYWYVNDAFDIERLHVSRRILRLNDRNDWR